MQASDCGTEQEDGVQDAEQEAGRAEQMRVGGETSWAAPERRLLHLAPYAHPALRTRASRRRAGSRNATDALLGLIAHFATLCGTQSLCLTFRNPSIRTLGAGPCVDAA
jgi:hypothetical protein